MFYVFLISKNKQTSEKKNKKTKKEKETKEEQRMSPENRLKKLICSRSGEDFSRHPYFQKKRVFFALTMLI